MRLQVGWIVIRIFVLAVLLASALPGEAQDLAARQQQLTRRVDEVYQLFVSGDFRKVEPYLTEESKDIWFAQAKGKYDSFRLESIQVAPDGLRADVTVVVTFRVALVPHAPFTQAQKTEWLFQNDEWFLKLKPVPSALDMFKPEGNQPAPVTLESPIRFEQNPIHIPPTERGSETVVKVSFQNVAGEVASVRSLSANCDCLRVEVDKSDLQPQETGTLTITYRAPARPPIRALAIHAMLHPGTYLLRLPVIVGKEE